MTEEEWRECADREIMLEFLRGGLSVRKLRLFAVASVRPFWDLLIDPRSRKAVLFTERRADQPQPTEDPRTVYREAWVAVPQLPSDREAHVSAARAAARTTEYDACEVCQLIWNEIVALHRDLSEERGVTDTERDILYRQGQSEGERFLCGRIREIFGNPFRPVAFSPEWRTDTAMTLARQMYESRDFSAAPILADALQDAGCDSDALLNHLRDPNATHVRGCWALDVVLGKE